MVARGTQRFVNHPGDPALSDLVRQGLFDGVVEEHVYSRVHQRVGPREPADHEEVPGLVVYPFSFGRVAFHSAENIERVHDSLREPADEEERRLQAEVDAGFYDWVATLPPGLTHGCMNF